MDARVDIDTGKTFPSFAVPELDRWGLGMVPGWRPLPGVDIPPGWVPTPGEVGYEDPQWRIEHKAYSRELRDSVRPAIHGLGNSHAEFAAMERVRCARNPNYFGLVYGWIQDPQPLEDEEQDKPYAKFAYQCDNTVMMQDWVFRPRKERAVIWRSKSRQLGISWDDELFDLWFYLFQRGKAKLASRSEEWVDSGEATHAMFGKLRYVLKQIAEHTPYLLPHDEYGAPYTIKKLLSPPNSKHMMLTNPETGTEITGEATTAKVGRGGTYTYGRLDEDAFVRDLNQTLTSMRGSCPRIFCASTEDFQTSDEHFVGWQTAKQERPDTVREYNWHQNAYLDLEWETELLNSVKTEAERQGIQREFFRNPFAGFGSWAYPEARDLPDLHQPYDPAVPLDVTMDPAGGGDDFALLAAQATGIGGREGFHVLWSYERKLPNPLRVAHMATGIWPEPGDQCYPWQPDPEERAIGQFMYDAWMDSREVRWFSDPAGDQIHSNASFLMQFTKLTKQLRDREYLRLKSINEILQSEGKEAPPLPVPKPVAVRFRAIKSHRLLADREYALRPILPNVTFQQGVRSAARVRECLGRTSYNELSKSAVTEPKRKHDQFSHLASCCENYALYFRYRFVDPLDTKALRQQQRQLGIQPGRAPGAPKLPMVKIPSKFGQRKTGGMPGRGLPRNTNTPPDRVSVGGN